LNLKQLAFLKKILSGYPNNDDLLFKSKTLVMENKLVRSALAGVVATAIMTVFMLLAPMMGFPKMNPADMMSGMQ